MRAVTAIRLVAMREVRQRVRSRFFLIVVGITALAVAAAVIVLPKLLDRTDEPPIYKIGLVGESTSALEQALTAAAKASAASVDLQRITNVEAAETGILRGDLDAALVDGEELVIGPDTRRALQVLVSVAVQQVRFLDKLDAAGLSQAQTSALLAPSEKLQVRELGDKSGGLSQADELFTIGGVVVMLMAIILYGAAVLTGVVVEKSSRVVEVLLATLRPWHLLAGKLIGIGLLGLGQVLLLVVVGVVAALATDAIDLSATTLAAAGSALLWFVLGYSLYSVFFATVGALITRQEDAEGAALPVVLVANASLMFSMFATLADPEGIVLRVGSQIPLVAPFAMPVRAGLGVVEVWEIVLAVILMLGTIYGAVMFAGRLYAGSILSIGARVKLTDAWKSSDL